MGRTVVVGGGTAGLAAAYTLQSAGIDCTVLEKRDFAGGRIYGRKRDGFTLDLGAQFLFSRYHSTFDLLDRMGARDELVVFRPPVGLIRDGNLHIAALDPVENLRHPLEALKLLRLLSNSGRLGIAKFGARMLPVARKLDFDDPYKAVELDGISFADYANEYFGEEVLEYVFQPFASVLTLGAPEEISAAYGLGLMHYLAPGLSTFRKGIGYLADELSGRISELELNTTATRIVLENKAVKGVEVAGSGGNGFIDADNVVCCTLAGEAAALLPGLAPQMLETLSSIRYSACTHVMLAVPDRPLGSLYGIVAPRKEGFVFSGITDSAAKTNGYAPDGKGIIHAFTFGDFARDMLGWDDEAVKEKVMAEILRILPSFPPEPLFCEIFRWPKAVCLSSPGQIAAVQHLKSALPGYRGLYLAGEYMGMPSVEAAVHFGVQAAERIIGNN